MTELALRAFDERRRAKDHEGAVAASRAIRDRVLRCDKLREGKYWRELAAVTEVGKT